MAARARFASFFFADIFAPWYAAASHALDFIREAIRAALLARKFVNSFAVITRKPTEQDHSAHVE
ncbi:MAG: hypothetical protein ACREXP_27175, partial [Steroidobacteraceae bacterium]